MKRIDPRKWAGAFRSAAAPHALEQWQWQWRTSRTHRTRGASRVECDAYAATSRVVVEA